MAFITEKYIERPIRKENSNLKGIILLVAMVLTGYIGYNIYSRDGLVFRKIAILTTDLSSAKTDWEYQPTTLKNGHIENSHILKGESPDSILFIGDSLMGQYYPRVAELYSKETTPKYSTIFASRNHCLLPNTGILSAPEEANCDDYYLAAIEMARSVNVKKVVISGNWYHYFTNLDSASLDKNIEILSKDISNLVTQGKEVYLISMAPHAEAFDPFSIANQYRKSMIFSAFGFNYLPYMERKKLEGVDEASYASLKKIIQQSGAHLMNPYDYFCNKDLCYFLSGVSATHMDATHLRASYVKKKALFIDAIYLDTFSY